MEQFNDLLQLSRYTVYIDILFFASYKVVCMLGMD